MGFWQGLNAGLTAVQQEKARKTEIQEEREYRRQELAEQRKYEREQFLMQTAENRRDSLLTLFAKREQEKAEANALTGKAQSFFTRLGDIEDPRVAALANSPRVAAELEDKVQEIERLRAESDLDLPPLQGQVLLDMLVVQNPETGSVSPVNITLDDLLEMDMTDRGVYEQTALALSRSQPTAYATISPEAYRKVDPKRLEEGRNLFNQEILRLANDRINTLEAAAQGEVVPEADELRSLLEGFGTEDSAGRFALMDMFGPQAFANLAVVDNPYIQNLEQDPQLSRYSTIYKLQVILQDPEATEEEKAKAQELLDRFGG